MKFKAYVPKAQEHGIAFQTLHALDTKSKKSLVTLVDLNQDDNDSVYSGPTNFHILLCKKVGAHDEGVTRHELFEQITDW